MGRQRDLKTLGVIVKEGVPIVSVREFFFFYDVTCKIPFKKKLKDYYCF